MKEFKVQRTISIICCLIGIALSLYGLIVGLESIGATGFGGLGIIFIGPSVVALIIILCDFLIAIDKIKKGLIYSFISSLIKIALIINFIPSLIYNIVEEARDGVSNLDFDLIFIALLIVITIPSILNIIKLINIRKNSK